MVERWTVGMERPEIVSDQLVWRPDGARDALTIDVAALCAEALGEA